MPATGRLKPRLKKRELERRKLQMSKLAYGLETPSDLSVRLLYRLREEQAYVPNASYATSFSNVLYNSNVETRFS